MLFDRHDAASLLWPRRNAFEAMLAELNATELASVWDDDETIGWFYQFFNSKEERQQMRDASQAPRNSRELAVRNQFFTPRYVVQFLVDNTLGRTWIEMTNGDTSLTDRCEYFVALEDERARHANQGPARLPDPRPGLRLRPLPPLLLRSPRRHVPRGVGDAVSGEEEATGQTLRDTYPTLDELEQAHPVADRRAQPARRRHRPSRCPDRRTRDLATSPARLARRRHRRRRSSADPQDRHRHRRADAW